MSNKEVTDYEFFTSLENYSPILYKGYGQPWFLLNHKWYSSFFCVILSAIAYAACISFFYHYHEIRHEPEDSPNKTLALVIINIFMLTGLLVSFLMTQFLNPGIRNPHLISQSEFRQFGIKFCIYCEKNVLQTMQHCKDCKVCIQNKDHHCMFFQKCMGGIIQNYAFKMFLLFALFSILTLFITVVLYLI